MLRPATTKSVGSEKDATMTSGQWAERGKGYMVESAKLNITSTSSARLSSAGSRGKPQTRFGVLGKTTKYCLSTRHGGVACAGAPVAF